ncbi:MAG TPA: hypothetical protein VE907_08095 [Gammaproteobacteria bacterium]|nr:hypothetical protein [Gammaproteobacteria bacterium]
MPTPWFAPQHAVLFSFASLTSLLALLEPYARRGKHPVLVFGASVAVLLAAVATVVAAVIAHQSAQPGYVVFALAMSGGVVTSVTIPGLASYVRLYRNAVRERAATNRTASTRSASPAAGSSG